jgi:hypothetical protein
VILFATGDNVVYDGRQCLVKRIEGNEVRLLTSDGDYVTVDRDAITQVYYD